MSAAAMNVPREANAPVKTAASSAMFHGKHARRRTQVANVLPPAFVEAFSNLTAALDAPPPAPTWGLWQVEDRANGFQVVRDLTDGTQREFLNNTVGKLKVFRSEDSADAAAAKLNAGGAA